MNSKDKPRVLVADSERAEIDRKVLAWLSAYPELPVDMVKTESQLASNEPGMAVSAITSAYVNKSYIVGGYQAEYQFTLIYRTKPGNSMNKSLEANEMLNRIGDWAARNNPDFGNGIRVQRVEPISIAGTYALYDDGDEDHHIPIRITYEVV